MKKVISLFSTFISLAFPLVSSASSPQEVLVLDKDNHILLNGEINSKMSSEFISQMLKTKSDNLVVYINSPGGSVISGMKIVQTAKDIKANNSNLKITCYVDFAASMAFVITQTICDERIVGETSVLMQHQATFGVQGRTGEIAARTGMVLSILDVMDSAQAKRLKITKDELRKKSKDEWWLVGKNAVKNNAADCTAELVDLIKKETLIILGAKIELSWSSCPLVEYPVKIEVNRKDISPEEKTKIENKIYESIENRKKIFTTSP